MHRHPCNKCLTLGKAASTGQIYCPQMTLISYRDQASQAEEELVQAASAKVCAFPTYLKMKMSREEDARKPKEFKRGHW